MSEEFKQNNHRLYRVAVSPHFHSGLSTQKIMLDVILALIPALFFGVYLFGVAAVGVVVVSIGSCVIFEYLSNLILVKKQTISDLSAVLTGLLLAFTLPPEIPLWMVVVGAFVSIVVAKAFFGGIGNNFVNPALLGRIVMQLSFGPAMGTYAEIKPYAMNMADKLGFDVITGATQMAELKSYISTQGLTAMSADNYSLLNSFVGFRSGSIGEVSALCLCLGFAYLLYRRVIHLHIPLAYIVSAFICTLCFSSYNLYFALHSTLGGGLFLGAIFMATDYTTSPTTAKGKLIFGVGLGILTSLMRFYGNMPEGVSFSILFFNILLPYINQISTPRTFGTIRLNPVRKILQKICSASVGESLYKFLKVAFISILLLIFVYIVYRTATYSYMPEVQAVVGGQ